MAQKSHYHKLKSKWSKRHSQLKESLWSKHKAALEWAVEKIPAKKHIAAGSLGALMLLTTPAPLALPAPAPQIQQQVNAIDKKAVLIVDLAGKVPHEVRPLTTQEESDISQSLTTDYGFKVAPELQGIRLNRSYGLIGGEQHLYRYPGDTLANHAKTADERAMYLPSGIAPGLGAFRYFANSKSEMTPKDEEREKWYIAVQTFLAPGFNEHVKEYNDFFRYRKMLVVNPKTGQAVVADIADAGPSPWTGKSLGGSPEVMNAVGLATGPRKGAVLYFFIDDPNDTIPLGPMSPK